MNFLAHALLAGDDPALVVGGVVGDWIKGPLPGRLPPDLARGVALHRAIDSHAETQSAFRRSRARVSPARRRYAGVLVDIFYDHLLARDWEVLHHQPFAEYRHAVYRAVAARVAELPEGSHHALKLMAAEDWFQGYARLDGIADVLARMSRRARWPNPLAGGEAEFVSDPDGFRADFQEWLADSMRFAGEWR
jgi:acyl carrier protein phosphodiesterase